MVKYTHVEGGGESMPRRTGKKPEIKRLVYGRALLVIGALLFGKFKLWETSAVEAVRHTRIPILLIHGDDDRFVPCEMSEKIYSACVGAVELVIFPGAGHALSYFSDTPLYERTVRDFFRVCGIVQ